MYEDIMTTGDSGSFIAFAVLTIVVLGAVWYWRNRKK